MIEFPQQWASVAGVAPDSRVGPPVGITLEPTRKPDQFADLIDQWLWVTKGIKPPLGDAGSDLLMVTKGHPSMVEGPGVGFTYVMKQRSKAHGKFGFGFGNHGNGVSQNVLVTVNGILFHG